MEINSEIRKVIENVAKEAKIDKYEININENKFTGDNYMGDISRFTITPKNSEKKPITLITKIAPTSQACRDMAPVHDFFKNEIFIYEKIIPEFEKYQEDNCVPSDERLTFAKLYKGIKDSNKEMLIMRDLSDFGFILHNKKNPLNYEHSTLIIKTLARLHATSFAMKEKNPNLFSKLTTNNISNSMNYGDSILKVFTGLVQKVIDVINNPDTKRKVAMFLADINEKIYVVLDASLTDPYNVICHGDCWNNNILFRYEDQKPANAVLIDWQLVRLASPVTDLSYFMCMSMDPDIIASNFEDILDLYFSTLEAAIARMGGDPTKCYPRQIFQEHISKVTAFGLLMAVCGIPFVLIEPDKARNMEDTANDLNNGLGIQTVIDNIGIDRLNGLFDAFAKYDFI